MVLTPEIVKESFELSFPDHKVEVTEDLRVTITTPDGTIHNVKHKIECINDVFAFHGLEEGRRTFRRIISETKKELGVC